MSNCFDFPLPWMGLVFSLAKERLRAQLVEKQCPLVEDQATLQETQLLEPTLTARVSATF